MSFGIQKPFGGTNSEEILKHYRHFNTVEEKKIVEDSTEEVLRKIRNENTEYICPISFDLLLDPVICTDGHSYERKNIETWFKNHDTSPKTNNKLESKTLIPNHALRSSIESLVEKEEINKLLVEEWKERKKIVEKERKEQERRDRINRRSNEARQRVRELIHGTAQINIDQNDATESEEEQNDAAESDESYDEDVI